jgi:hypothetical protein
MKPNIKMPAQNTKTTWTPYAFAEAHPRTPKYNQHDIVSKINIKRETPAKEQHSCRIQPPSHVKSRQDKTSSAFKLGMEPRCSSRQERSILSHTQRQTELGSVDVARNKKMIRPKRHVRCTHFQRPFEQPIFWNSEKTTVTGVAIIAHP